jgi:hypothetical protein
VAQFEPGHGPPAALPPAPPGGQGRHELEPSAAFRVTAGRTQPRYAGAAAIGDLYPDDPACGPDLDRDRFPGSAGAAVPYAVAEKLACQQDCDIPARMSRPSTAATNERAIRARSGRPATVTLSRSAAAVISAPVLSRLPSLKPRKGAGGRRTNERSAQPRT